MKGNVEFVGGPKCGTVARGYVGLSETLTYWHQGDVVTYRRRDAALAGVDEYGRSLMSVGGNRMYDFERMASA